MAQVKNKRNPIKLFHHMAIDVSDMDKSIDFYRDLFGYKLTERHDAGEIEAIPVELAFLRIQNNHHDMVLSHTPGKKYRPRNKQDDIEGTTLHHHLAWQCHDREAWLEMLEKVTELGIAIIRGPVVHSKYDSRGEGSWGENESFYIFDLDGHRLEVFCDMASIDEDGTFVSFEGSRIEEAKAVEI
jgi:catechol 2,3-dioxygenase-like lactoylglutathione lyase family enzyme